MNLSHLTSDTLRNLIPLTEKRDDLIKNLRALESNIAAVLTGTATVIVEAVTPGKTEAEVKSPKRAQKGRTNRGKLKEKILSLLEAAGSAGLGVKEISDKLGVKAGNVYVWFGSTGKTLTTKVSRGRYAVKKSSAPAADKKAEPAKARPAAKTTKSVVKPKPAAATPMKGKRNISPEARAKMASAAKARWAHSKAASAVVPSKPLEAKKASKPAKKATKKVKKGFKLSPAE